MGKKYSRYKNSLERFLASEKGKRFFNISYSVGAGVVILGALFKINHYAYGTEILMIGMVAEAIIFFISAFDLPAREYKWDRVYPQLNRIQNGEVDDVTDEEEIPVTISSFGPAISKTSYPSGKETLIENSSTTPPSKPVPSGVISTTVQEKGGSTNTFSGGLTGNAYAQGSVNTTPEQTGEVISATEKYADQLNKMTANMEKFTHATDALTKISESLVESLQGVAGGSNTNGISTEGYLAQMRNLNRNIAGLNTIYEIQLKGVSGQISTIEEINSGLDRIKNLYSGSLVDSSVFKTETQRMAQQLTELNQVYARMLQAMTTNMNMNMGGGFGNMPGNTPEQK